MKNSSFIKNWDWRDTLFFIEINFIIYEFYNIKEHCFPVY